MRGSSKWKRRSAIKRGDSSSSSKSICTSSSFSIGPSDRTHYREEVREKESER